MKVSEALSIAKILVGAVERATKEGKDTIDVLNALQATDDAAREELESAIAEIEATLSNARS